MDFIRRLISLLRAGTKPRSPSVLLAEASGFKWGVPSAQAESDLWHIRRTILEQKIASLRHELEEARGELDSLRPPLDVLFLKIRTAISHGDTVTFHFHSRMNMPVTLHWDGFRYEWPDAAVAIMQLTACGAKCVVEKQFAEDIEQLDRIELDEITE